MIDVPRGLFSLRYVEPVNASAPLVVFHPASGSEHLLSILPYPGNSPTSFERVNQHVVISSLGGARLQITVRAAHPGATLDARLELENLDRAASQAAAAQVSPLPYAQSSNDAGVIASRPAALAPSLVPSNTVDGEPASDIGLTVIGHVARRGNVAVACGEWIAGPSAPAPIEGIAFQTKPNAALWFEAQVLVGGEQNWTDWRTASQYLGTQGRARPLVGIRLRTSQVAPSDLELDAAALFLGSPVIKRTGRQIELRSAAGGDPLVGLCIDIRRERQVARAIAAEPRLDRLPRGRVRVFRAGVERAAS